MDKKIDSGFDALLCESPKVLLLGSMPSQRSLETEQYYGHPQNAFWWIMEQLFGVPVDAPYNTRINALCQNQIILWDVIQSCHRPGSMDADIDLSTLKPNDFAGLFDRYPDILWVGFNGQAAAKLFRKHVLSGLNLPGTMEMGVLPSTSPAYAAITRQQKLERWRVIEKYLKESHIGSY